MRTFAAELQIKNYIGVALISLGVLMLTGLHLAGITFVNVLLVIPLLFIIGGTVVHVWWQKRS